MAKDDLTAARLRELVLYDASTGVFRRRKIDGSLKEGGYGSLESNGRYLVCGFLGLGTFRLHRLAWLYVYGSWPVGVIDHINGDKTDNRIKNLRDVSIKLNAENRRNPSRQSQSGVLGVYKWRNKWKVMVGGKYVGLESTKEAAYALYVQAKRQSHAGCTL